MNWWIEIKSHDSHRILFSNQSSQRESWKNSPQVWRTCMYTVISFYAKQSLSICIWFNLPNECVMIALLILQVKNWISYLTNYESIFKKVDFYQSLLYVNIDNDLESSSKIILLMNIRMINLSRQGMWVWFPIHFMHIIRIIRSPKKKKDDIIRCVYVSKHIVLYRNFDRVLKIKS